MSDFLERPLPQKFCEQYIRANAALFEEAARGYTTKTYSDTELYRMYRVIMHWHFHWLNRKQPLDLPGYKGWPHGRILYAAEIILRNLNMRTDAALEGKEWP